MVEGRIVAAEVLDVAVGGAISKDVVQNLGVVGAAMPTTTGAARICCVEREEGRSGFGAI
jgi:hypothetical protein